VDRVVPFSPERRRMCSFVWVPDDEEYEVEDGREYDDGGGHYRMYVKGADKARLVQVCVALLQRLSATRYSTDTVELKTVKRTSRTIRLVQVEVS
jgi:magnesium-transporting ATPase (P-type)